MPEDFYYFSLFLAVLGGYVRYFMDNETQAFSFFRLFNSLVVSAFSGLLACSLMGFLGLENRDIQGVFAGVAGYGGQAFLNDVVNRLRTMFLSKLEKTEEKEIK